MRKYKVYCHTNKIDGKKYIGVTGQKLNARFRNGNGYKGCTVFWRAIEKYGWEEFSTEVLFEDLTENEASIKEQYLIDKWNTQAPNGYNIEGGGLTNSIMAEETKIKIGLANGKPINQYSMNGEFIREWDSINQASRELGVSNRSIGKCCTKNRLTANGYVWRFVGEDNSINVEEININHQPHIKPVKLYDLENNYLGEWESYSELGRYLGVSGASISANIKLGCKTFMKQYRLEGVID